LTSIYLPLFDASPRILVPHTTFSSLSSSLLRWDVFYFSSIAKDGYLYEYHWAFFPGIPWLSRLAEILPAFRVDDTTAAHAWVALLHAALAIPTTRAIYNLTLIHFRSPSFSLLTALLSLLPASPVTLYFAPYAEPIFTFLSYRGVCTPLYISRSTSYLCSQHCAPQECLPVRMSATSLLRCSSRRRRPSGQMVYCLLFTSLGP
jgi:GPI mannosyltransferase 2